MNSKNFLIDFSLVQLLEVNGLLVKIISQILFGELLITVSGFCNLRFQLIKFRHFPYSLLQVRTAHLKQGVLARLGPRREIWEPLQPH